MDFNIENYSLKQLGNVAEVMSATTFRSRMEKGLYLKPGTTYIKVPKYYIPNKMQVEIDEKPPIQDGFVVIAKDDIEDNIFLSCILNSHVAWQYLTNGNLDSRATILKKNLDTIPVRLLSKEMQSGVVYLYYLIGNIINLKSEGKNDSLLDYRESLYRELLDGVVLELTIPKLFKEFEIDLFFSWCSLMGKCYEEHPDVTIENMQDIIGNKMVNPDNPVTHNMKKLRIVVQKISEQLAGKI